MNHVLLNPGVYLNIFPVKVPENAVQIMTASRASFQDLRSIREYLAEEGKSAWVYAYNETVYGYGPDAACLESRGFQKTLLRLTEVPRLATRMVIEGIVNILRREGYEILPRKGRQQAYHPERFMWVIRERVRVHRGYDLRALFWKNIHTDQIAFGLIVDIFWALRDDKNQPLSMHQIRQQYGYNATITISQIQGEYLPGSSKLNTEVARQRFHEHILPFVQSHSEFDLPCGGRARLLLEPIRVILGEEER